MRTIRAPETGAAELLDRQPDEAAIAAYEQAGAIVVRGLIGAEWIDRLRENYAGMAQLAIMPSAKGVPTPETRLLGMRFGMWQDSECFRSFLFESPIARAAATAMRSRTAQLYEDLLLTEPAGGTPHTSWHQDEPTWPVNGRMLSSVWFSLEPVTADTGAMRFVEGSSRGPLYYPPHVKAEDVGDDVLRWTGGAFPQVDNDASTTIIQTETEPGDAVIFHPRAIHCAYGSSPEHARRTFTIRFLGEDVRWLPRNRMFHAWMAELGLKQGDRIDSPRLPIVYDVMA